MRNALIAAVALALALVVVAVLAGRDGAPPAASPSPTVAAASPTAAASPSATPSPAQDRFVNAALRYSIALPPPWHRTECGSFTRAPGGPFIAQDTFIALPEREFTMGGVGGINVDHIYVLAAANPERSSPRAWAATRPGREATDISDVTFADRPAARARVAVSPSVPGIAVFVAQGDVMYEVAYGAAFGSSAGPELERIVSSFRFEPSASAPSPTPPASPARSAEQVADMLADGFARRDADALGRLMVGCMTLGAQNGGGSGRTRPGYVEDLRQLFARGLAVTVRTRPVVRDTRTPEVMFVAQAVWRDPGQAEREVDLWIREDGAAWYWSRTIFYNVPRRSP